MSATYWHIHWIGCEKSTCYWMKLPEIGAHDDVDAPKAAMGIVRSVFACSSNSDSGADHAVQRAEELCRHHADLILVSYVFKNLWFLLHGSSYAHNLKIGYALTLMTLFTKEYSGSERKSKRE